MTDQSTAGGTIPAEEAHAIAAAVVEIQAAICEAVRRSMVEKSVDELTRDDDSNDGDTAYGIDRVGESALVELVATHLRPWLPVVVVAEGLSDIGHGAGVAVVPADASEAEARFRVIVDPIDGTRGLMYAKRSAWVLTGVAVQGAGTPTLRDIDVAVQTEIPPPKQSLADTMLAVRGHGATAFRRNLDTGESSPLDLRPSTATSIAHGFGQLMRGFPGGRDVLGAIDDDICRTLLGPGQEGKAATFEDQYISTGGQLAELVQGHDRWVADLRPLLSSLLIERGLPRALCCHPYDVCTALIAQEVGVAVLAPDGSALDAPLTLDADVAWAGFANDAIRDAVLPVLIDAARARGLPL